MLLNLFIIRSLLRLNRSLRTDWDKYNWLLENYFLDFLSSDYEQMSACGRYEFFVDKITDALKRSTPNKRSFDKKLKIKNLVSWWDEECNKIKRLRQACNKKWYFTHDLKHLIQYKKACAVAKKILKRKKEMILKNLLNVLIFKQTLHMSGTRVKFLRISG